MAIIPAKFILFPSPKPLILPSRLNFLNPTKLQRRSGFASFSSSSYRNGSTQPETDCPVPFDQQPINEYNNLSTSFPFNWASADFLEYCSRLFVTGAAFALFVGVPVAWSGAVGPDSEPLKRILAAASSGVLVVTLAVVRMYLGWAYVGNRLLSATVEYEETGWYDGQIWVKTAEVLARDRLLGSYSVKPVLNRLKLTLVTLAASLFACVVVLVNIEDGRKVYYYRTPEELAGRANIPGVYNDKSARAFEPDAFCGEPQELTLEIIKINLIKVKAARRCNIYLISIGSNQDEETGWYDGQIWAKTAEVLARDRLLGSYSYTVSHSSRILKLTLVTLAASLFACVVVLVNIEDGRKVYYYRTPEEPIFLGYTMTNQQGRLSLRTHPAGLIILAHCQKVEPYPRRFSRGIQEHATTELVR
ncbi:hypothetical protein QQ045_018156 [Rhodiola kirilowii]